MNVVELIRKKRDKQSLSEEEIRFLIYSYTKNKIPDYQFSAFLMAVFLNGMGEEETSALTKAMLTSGKTINLESIPGSKVDKHSTGGVGDKTSLIIAPIAAAAGINVPMISGRGLGHTGGTLDKLESIPGFKTNLSLTEYKAALKKCGAVLIGQTRDIAPADKLIYSLRDVTSTVESIPLITASIMSKKLAEGIDSLVLDVKTGSGAFIKNIEDSKKLTQSLVNTAKAFNKKVMAFITDMNQPLGYYIGNWLEVYESINVLRGGQADDLLTLSATLSGAMIFLGGKASTIEEGIEISESLIKNGSALKKFYDIVKCQGGNLKSIENPEKYPVSKHIDFLISGRSGYISKMDTFQIGLAALELGAGRKVLTDRIDHKAGIIFKKKLSDYVEKGEIIAELHSSSSKRNEVSKIILENALEFSPEKIRLPKLIKFIYC
jgi:pyrimidine-nucleoside phosphorylase